MANHIWTSVMTKIHKNLINANFDKPGDVEEVMVCKDSGKKASDWCKDVYVEYFRKGTVPNERCELVHR